MRKVSRNGKIKGQLSFSNNQVKGYCIKADIKHYFEEVDHEILLSIIKRKIKDEKVIWLMKRIIERDGDDLISSSRFAPQRKGMPLGNLTSQFFANIYLNELDYFVKHNLKAKFYIRYVDDFVLLHNSKTQLEGWKEEIDIFLRKELKLELHKDKSKIISLSNGVDFVGFRNQFYFKSLRKRNIRNMKNKIIKYVEEEVSKEEMCEIFQGWNAYAKWGNSFELRKRINSEINSPFTLS